jgi:PAS domain S-box-containing protein
MRTPVTDHSRDGGSWWRRMSASIPALIAAAMLPIAIGLVALVVELETQARQAKERESLELAHTLSATFDAEMTSAVRLAEALAVDEQLTRGDYAGFSAEIHRILPTQPQTSAILVTDLATGSYLAHTALPPGNIRPAGDVALAQSRIVAEQGRSMVFGVRPTGPVVTTPLIPVRVPIVRDGKIAQVLSMDISSTYLSEVYRRANFGEDRTGALVDPNLLIAARNRAPEQFVGKRITQPLEQAIEAKSEGIFDSVNQEGQHTNTVFVRSPATGWISVVGVPRQEVEDAVWRIILPVIVLGVLLCAVGIASAAFIAVRIRRNREMIRDADARMRAIVDTVVDGIITIDTSGNIETYNPAAARIFGYQADAVIGRNVAMLVPEPLRGELDADLATYLQGGDAKIFGDNREVVGLRNGGERFSMDLGISRFNIGDKVMLAGICHDVSDRKRAEREILVANKELETFAYSVSHDLRAPLRGIDGFSRALEEEYGGKLEGDGHDYIKRIRAATRRMSQLIDDLLQLSRVTRGEIVREPVDLSAMAEKVMGELRDGEPARKVQVAIEPGLQCRGDPRLIAIVLDNLLDNAWKYTGKTAEARIEFGAAKLDEAAPAFYIRDNGAGFDMAYAKRLFLPFQRLHSAQEFEGTGIGLATVSRIIQRHGGRVWAEGEVGKGATITFTLSV